LKHEDAIVMKENFRFLLDKMLIPMYALWAMMLIFSCLMLTGCTLSYTVTQAHGSGSDIVDEDQKTDAQPNIDLSIPNPLNALKV
jgi:hypothetical protein